MIVDCHFHWPYRDERAAAEDPSLVLEVMDRHGIDKVVLMAFEGIIRAGSERRENELLARVAAQAPDRLIPVGTAWPQQGRAAVDEARRCIDELGLRGFKFHPWLQGFSTADETFAEICALAGERRVPVLFHDGTPCYCVSEQIGGLARRFPQTDFVLGHSGLLWNWRSALDAAKHPNVWPCMCGPHMRAMEIFSHRVDSRRILWGTDYTGSPGVIEYRLPLARHAKMDEQIRTLMLGENALRLFGG